MTIKSVRLGDGLEQRLDAAARAQSRPASEIIRDAVARQCDEILGDTLDGRLADVVGKFASAGEFSSERTGESFKALLTSRRHDAD